MTLQLAVVLDRNLFDLRRLSVSDHMEDTHFLNGNASLCDPALKPEQYGFAMRFH